MSRKVKIINAFNVPPFYWVNQFRHLFCCGFSRFDLLNLNVTRSTDGGLHLQLFVVIFGLGFCGRWYDRISRTQWLQFMDQIEATAKDIVRAKAEEQGEEIAFDGDDE